MDTVKSAGYLWYGRLKKESRKIVSKERINP